MVESRSNSNVSNTLKLQHKSDSYIFLVSLKPSAQKGYYNKKSSMTTYGVPKAASTTTSSSGGDRAYTVLARATTNASADPNEPGPSHRGDCSALREVKRAIAQRGF